MSMKNLLAGLSGDNQSSIERAITTIAARLRNAPGDEEAEQALNTLKQTLSTVGLDDQERIRLASFEKWSEQNFLPDLIGKLSGQITDFASASRAVSGFDIKWFATQPISNEGKQQLAGALMQLTQKYSGNYNSFWQALVNGDAEALIEVSFDIISEENQELGT